jgi:indoleamine 2,3-dioxygenase
MRSYMPGKHRDFLEEVAKLPNLRTFVEKHPTDEDLNRAYNDCMKQLRSWRSTHIAIVSKYIVGPGLRAGDELTGTGGSSPMSFLKQSRDETVGIA